MAPIIIIGTAGNSDAASGDRPIEPGQHQRRQQQVVLSLHLRSTQLKVASLAAVATIWK